MIWATATAIYKSAYAIQAEASECPLELYLGVTYEERIGTSDAVLSLDPNGASRRKTVSERLLTAKQKILAAIHIRFCRTAQRTDRFGSHTSYRISSLSQADNGYFTHEFHFPPLPRSFFQRPVLQQVGGYLLVLTVFRAQLVELTRAWPLARLLSAAACRLPGIPCSRYSTGWHK